MTIQDMRSKTLEELVSLSKETRFELAKSRLKKNLGVSEAANKIPFLRKSIARLETIIAEKKRGL